METPTICETPFEVRSENLDLNRVICICCAVLLFLMILIPELSRAQMQQAKPTGSEPTPEAAVPAILAAFEKYEVVGMPEAHGLKDVDDFILSLIRNPAFAERVNDIEVECGNSLYQPVLDSYIAGEDVRSRKSEKYGETRRRRCAARRDSLSSSSLL
jgi:hypothetical protein